MEPGCKNKLAFKTFITLDFTQVSSCVSELCIILTFLVFCPVSEKKLLYSRKSFV